MNYEKVKRLFEGNITLDNDNSKKNYTKVEGDVEKLRQDKLMVYMNWVSCDAIATGFKPTNW